MAIVTAQFVAGTTQASPVSVSESFVSTPGTGSLIVVVSHLRHSALSPPDVTITDNQGNTYTTKVNTVQGRVRTTQAFINLPASSGTFTVTVTPASTPAGMKVDLYEITGQATSGVDEASNSSVGSGTSQTTGTVTPAGNALYTATVTIQPVSSTITEEAAAGWALDSESQNGTIVCSSLSQVSSGTIDGDWTSGSSGNWAANIVAWKEAGGAATDAADNPNEWDSKNDLIVDVDEQFDNVESSGWSWENPAAVVDSDVLYQYDPFIEEIAEYYENTDSAGWSWENPAVVVDSDVLYQYDSFIEEIAEYYENTDSAGWSWENPAAVVDSDVLYQYDPFIEEIPEQFDNVESSGWSWENPAVVPSTGDFPDEFSSYYEFEAERFDYQFDNNFETELYTQLPAIQETVTELYVREQPITIGDLLGIGKYLDHYVPLGSFVPTSGRIYYTPFYLNQDEIIVELGVIVATVDLDAQARIGIYFNNRGRPGKLIYQNIINLNSIGFVSIQSNIHIASGLYWIALISDMNSGGIRGIDVLTAPKKSIGVIGSSDLTTVTALYGSQAFGALPDEADIQGHLTGGSVPFMRAKIR